MVPNIACQIKLRYSIYGHFRPVKLWSSYGPFRSLSDFEKFLQSDCIQTKRKGLQTIISGVAHHQIIHAASPTMPG